MNKSSKILLVLMIALGFTASSAFAEDTLTCPTLASSNISTNTVSASIESTAGTSYTFSSINGGVSNYNKSGIIHFKQAVWSPHNYPNKFMCVYAIPTSDGNTATKYLVGEPSITETVTPNPKAFGGTAYCNNTAIKNCYIIIK